VYFTKDEVIDRIIIHLIRLGIANVRATWFKAYRSHFLFGWLQGLRDGRIPSHLVDMLMEHDVEVPHRYRPSAASRS